MHVFARGRRSDLDHLLAYAKWTNSRRDEGVVRFRRKQPFAGFVSVLLLRQVLYRAQNYGSVQTGIGMAMCNQWYRLASIGKCCHWILLVVIGTDGLQPEQNFV